MSRVEIKSWSKNTIKGNVWNILKGILVVCAISYALSFVETILNILFGYNEFIGLILSIISIFIIFPLSFGLIKYFKNFIINGQTQLSDITSLYGSTVKIVLLMLIVTALIIGGTILFVIPGIILSLSLSIIPYIYENNKDKSIMQIINLSFKIMKGHKVELFVLMLSFIGWFILSILTLGILYIWVLPYYQISLAKFYLEVENNYNKNHN